MGIPREVLPAYKQSGVAELEVLIDKRTPKNQDATILKWKKGDQSQSDFKLRIWTKRRDMTSMIIEILDNDVSAFHRFLPDPNYTFKVWTESNGPVIAIIWCLRDTEDQRRALTLKVASSNSKLRELNKMFNSFMQVIKGCDTQDVAYFNRGGRPTTLVPRAAGALALPGEQE